MTRWRTGRTTERVESRRHTRLDGAPPVGGGIDRRTPRCRCGIGQPLCRPQNETRRPTGVSVYSEAVSAALLPGGRKREGLSPAGAETAPAGSGRRSRLGPGPKDAPSPGTGIDGMVCPLSGILGWSIGPTRRVADFRDRSGKDRPSRTQASANSGCCGAGPPAPASSEMIVFAALSCGYDTSKHVGPARRWETAHAAIQIDRFQDTR